MSFSRSFFAAPIVAVSLSFGLAACGDDDGKGAAEEIEKGVNKGADKVEKEGRELEDDVRGRDEKKQKKK